MPSSTLISALGFACIPIVALFVCALITIKWRIGVNKISMFQHMAAGVVTASVTLELVPVLLKAGSMSGMLIGYGLGVTCMLMLERYAELAGEQLAISLDLLIDGFLLAIGFATGEHGGLLLLFGLTLETVALGFVIGPSLGKQTINPLHRVIKLCGFGLALISGTGLGLFLPEEKGFVFAALIGFGVAALLYLVVEELLTEAHEIEDTPLTTALFFAGFVIPLTLVQLNI